MANVADSASNNTNSPRSSGDGINSPQFRRSPPKNNNIINLSSPWVHIVRREFEAIAPQPKIASDSDSPLKPSSSDDSVAVLETQMESSDSNASREKKKPAWKKPTNDAVEVGSVMGADSWPALSESARALQQQPKSSSDSIKPVSVSQGGHVVAPSPQKQFTNNANPNSTPNRAFPVRQKSIKRGANGGFNQQPPPPPPLPPPSSSSSVVDITQNKPGKPGPIMVPESSTRDPSHKNNNWENGPRGGFGSQPHIGNDHHPPHRNSSFRRGNGGPHPRADTSYHHNNYAGRHDGNHEWNHPHRNINGRDPHMQHQQQRVVPRGFIRPQPPTTGPVFGPLPVRPYGNPMGFYDMTSPVYYVRTPPPHESFRNMPFVHAPPAAVYIPAPDPQLMSLIVKQIDFYFSSENLCKDIFLRTNMDEQGWVPISLIAGFNRVKSLTSEIQLISDAIRTSTVVEVQGDKMRKRNDWMKWPLSSSNQFASVPAPESPSPGTANADVLANQIRSIGLEEGKVTNHNSMVAPADPYTGAVPSTFSSGELNYNLQTSNGKGTSSD